MLLQRACTRYPAVDAKNPHRPHKDASHSASRRLIPPCAGLKSCCYFWVFWVAWKSIESRCFRWISAFLQALNPRWLSARVFYFCPTIRTISKLRHLLLTEPTSPRQDRASGPARWSSTRPQDTILILSPSSRTLVRCQRIAVTGPAHPVRTTQPTPRNPFVAAFHQARLIGL